MIDPATFNPKPFWTVLQLADFLSISRAAAYRLLDNGTIAWNAFGSSRRIPLEAVKAYVAATSKGAAASN